MDPKEMTTDVLIFCALSEEATYFRKAVKQFCGIEFERHRNTDDFISYHATITTYDGTPLTLRLAFAGATGPDTTATQLTHWLATLHPTFVGMTGVCAGNSDKTQLGDIIISAQVYSDVAGKMLLAEETVVLNRQIDTESIDPQIRNRIQDTDFHKEWEQAWQAANIVRPVSMRHQREWLLDHLATRGKISAKERAQHAPDYGRVLHDLQRRPVPQATPVSMFLDAEQHLTEAGRHWISHEKHSRPKDRWPFQDRLIPAILPGVTACVPYVVAHDFFRKVNGSPHMDRNVIAVEMEALAFYRTANTHFHNSRSSLLVKGVCDYADPDKDDSCRDYAGLAAASFLLHYIRRYVKPISRSAEPPAPPVLDVPQPAPDVFRSWPQGDAATYIPRPEKEREILGYFTRQKNPARLVTLKGFGGMGKTRLAIACCRQAADLLGVEIAAVRLDNTLPSAEALVEEIAGALGFSDEQATPSGLLTALSNRPSTLLLLDNFESVVSSKEVRVFVRRLVQEVPPLRLLITGREAVRLMTLEQRVEIEGLASDEARALFVDRAQRVQPGWEPIRPEEQEALQEILELTESIPLALELVASGMDPDVLGSVIAVRDTLRHTPRSAPPPGVLPGSPEERHQSLTHCLDWSYQRLTPAIQAGFARLGLFADTFSEEAIEKACGVSEAQALRIRLMQASLVKQDTGQPNRYRLLRPTQDYAREKLKTTSNPKTIQQAFVKYYANLINANQNINNAVQKAILDREWRNALGAAELSSHADDWYSLALLAYGMRDYFHLSTYGTEAIRLQELTLQSARSHNHVAIEADCIRSLGDIALRHFELEAARQRYEEALPLYRQVGDMLGVGGCIRRLGDIALQRSDHETARQRFEEALPLFRQIGDVLGKANCIHSLGNIALRSSDHETARKCYVEALPLYKQVRSVLGQANCIQSLGNIALDCADHEAARQRYEEALPLFRQIGDMLGLANCINGLGAIALRRSDHETARQSYEEALLLYQQVGDVMGKANCIQSLGDIALECADHEAARQCYEEALELYGRIPEPYSIGGTHYRLARLAVGEPGKQPHVRAARTAWISIQRSDLIQKLDEEFGDDASQ